jgi:hypothetical protein
MFHWMLASRWIRSAIALAKVEMMINVSIEMLRPVEPGSSPDEYTTREPLRAIVAIRRAVIGGNLVVSIRTNRRRSDID